MQPCNVWIDDDEKFVDKTIECKRKPSCPWPKDVDGIEWTWYEMCLERKITTNKQIIKQNNRKTSATASDTFYFKLTNFMKSITNFKWRRRWHYFNWSVISYNLSFAGVCWLLSTQASASASASTSTSSSFTNYMFGVHVMRESNDLKTNPILLLCVGWYHFESCMQRGYVSPKLKTTSKIDYNTTKYIRRMNVNWIKLRWQCESRIFCVYFNSISNHMQSINLRL